MKTTALALNLLVAEIGTIQFWRMGLLPLRTFYPFAVLGFPFSLIGGAVQLPSGIYYPVVGAIRLKKPAPNYGSARSRRRSRYGLSPWRSVAPLARSRAAGIFLTGRCTTY